MDLGLEVLTGQGQGAPQFSPDCVPPWEGLCPLLLGGPSPVCRTTAPWAALGHVCWLPSMPPAAPLPLLVGNQTLLNLVIACLAASRRACAGPGTPQLSLEKENKIFQWVLNGRAVEPASLFLHCLGCSLP